MTTPAISLQIITLATAADRGWHLRMGDPSLIDWVITAAHFVSVYLSHAAHRSSQDAARSHS